MKGPKALEEPAVQRRAKPPRGGSRQAGSPSPREQRPRDGLSSGMQSTERYEVHQVSRGLYSLYQHIRDSRSLGRGHEGRALGEGVGRGRGGLAMCDPHFGQLRGGQCSSSSVIVQTIGAVAATSIVVPRVVTPLVDSVVEDSSDNIIIMGSISAKESSRAHLIPTNGAFKHLSHGEPDC